MSRHHATCLYQETRLSPDPTTVDSVVGFSLPAHSANAHPHRPAPKRRRIEKPTSDHDEDTFARQHLASESRIHFRHNVDQSKDRLSPHSILWRVLDDRKILELQAVDLYQDGSEKEQYGITLRFEFYSAIRSKGVTFSDTPEGSTGPLIVFIITRLGELYELKIPRQAFARANVLGTQPSEASKWFSSDVPNALSYHPAHNFIAKSDSELWVSSSDGSLVRLERRDTPEGEVTWHESWFTEGSWVKSLSSLIPFKSASSAQFDGVNLNYKTALALAAAPDGAHIWTVCLDHTLKAWDINSGRVILNLDLGGDLSRDMEKPIDRLLDPTHSDLLNLIPSKTGGDEYDVAVFSPWTRQFKFWRVRDATSAEHGVADLQPDFEFIPPIEDLIDTNVWTLEEFHIKPFNDRRKKDWTLWILVRSGSRCHTLHCHFNPRDSIEHLTKAWRTHWSDVSAGLLAADALDLTFGGPAEWVDEVAQSGPQGVTTKWTDFLSYPGRYSDATLEAALTVYRRSLTTTRRPAAPSPLQDSRDLLTRICDSVGSAVVLGRNEDRTPAFDEYNKAVAAQWHIFYGVVKDLHRRREGVLSLALDPEHDMPWIVMAGLVSPVRRCAELDTLCHNRAALSKPDAIPHDSRLLHEIGSRDNVELGGLLHAAKAFRQTMSGSFLQAFRFALDVDMQRSSQNVSWDRLAAIYDQAGFEVSNEDYSALLSSLDSALGGFGSLSGVMIADILDLLQEKQRGHQQKRVLSPTGFKALIRGGQELLQNGLEVLTDVLLLVVFIGADLEEQDMPPDLEPASAFDALMKSYRQYSLLHWLASKTIVLSRDSLTQEADLVRSKPRDPPAVTLMEWLFGGDWNGMLSPPSSDADLLTYWSRAWTLGPPVEDSYDELTAHIRGRLLKHGDVSLSRQFAKFASHDPWGRYVGARSMLTQGDYSGAANTLKQLQPDLDGNFAVQDYDRVGFLDLEQRNQFNAGSTRYYQHVVALFDKAKGAMSYVAEFATLGLRSLDREISDGEFDGDEESTRTEFLSRLFTAYIKTSRLIEAYDVLKTHTDGALRRASLQAFLSATLAKNRTKLLLSLQMSDDLAEEVDEHLATMASKSFNEDRSPFDVSGGALAPYKVLYAWRISRNDMRGAASCLWEQLQRLRQAQHNGSKGEDAEDQIASTYLAMINCLSLVQPEMAWILVRPIANVQKPRFGRAAPVASETKPKRKVVTLEDMRKEWQQELDRVADIAAGRYVLPFDMTELEDGHATSGALDNNVEMDIGT
ncbi:hypothetical protein FH972_026516 [Carpinus fangiana]|uniref:Uncharacterized protein n=1 Tax=Carpinus fangiana TaxID=176857 RepID=A0A5N6L568_9ROSI|nr:hypothetical protein FH972_026516 [Carpinus fangiana]